jgi:hypothetical protein
MLWKDGTTLQFVASLKPMVISNKLQSHLVSYLTISSNAATVLWSVPMTLQFAASLNFYGNQQQIAW